MLVQGVRYWCLQLIVGSQLHIGRVEAQHDLRGVAQHAVVAEGNAQALQARAGRIAESFKLGMFYRPAGDQAPAAQ